MSRRRKGERVRGPYKNRNSWRVEYVDREGEARPFYASSKEEAQKLKRALEADIQHEQQDTEGAVKLYRKHLEHCGNKKSAIDTTMHAMRRFFPVPLELWALTERRGKQRYQELVEKYAVDTHRNSLAEVKTFLNWCVAQRWIGKNPYSGIRGQGRRKKGKPQLRHNEARIWFATAMKLAEQGDQGALAAIMTLVLGMRASEVVTRLVRDVDTVEEPCDLLWIPESKSEAGQRNLGIPMTLRSLFVALVEGRSPDEPLFKPATKTQTGFRWRDWPRHNVQRICKLAGLDPVSAHSMRGVNATVAYDHGVVAESVARSLGHGNTKVTREHYAKPGAGDDLRTENVLKVLEGGKM